MALIALGTTLTLFGVLAFGVLLSIVVNSGRFVHVLAIPLGMTLLGAVLVRYGIRARPRV